MGQAKRKLEIKVDLQKMAAERAAYRRTIPRRIFKAVAALIVFIPLMLLTFAMESYRQDRWPWYLQ